MGQLYSRLTLVLLLAAIIVQACMHATAYYWLIRLSCHFDTTVGLSVIRTATPRGDLRPTPINGRRYYCYRNVH